MCRCVSFPFHNHPPDVEAGGGELSSRRFLCRAQTGRYPRMPGALRAAGARRVTHRSRARILGVVAETGTRVRDFRIGDRVLGFTGSAAACPNTGGPLCTCDGVPDALDLEGQPNSGSLHRHVARAATGWAACAWARRLSFRRRKRRRPCGACPRESSGRRDGRNVAQFGQLARASNTASTTVRCLARTGLPLPCA